MTLVKILKALGDETRLRILNLLKERELCVCELEALLNINQSNASRHLNKLTNSNLLTFEKRGHYVYYSLNAEIIEKFPFLNVLLKENLNELKQCEKDRERLSAYIKSGITCEELREGKLSFLLGE